VTTNNSTDSGTNGQDNLPHVEQFRAVEILNDFYAANGWTSDYVQVKPGQLTIEISSLAFGDIVLGREKVDRLVVGSAQSADAMFSILMSLNGGEPRVSGHKISKDNLLVIPPGIDMDIAMDAGTDVATIVIPIDMLGEYFTAIGNDDSLLETQDIASLQVHNGHIEPLRRLTRDLLSGRSVGNALDSTFASRLAQAMVPEHARTAAGDRYRRLSRHRIVERAREYIHDHLAEPILIPELCSYCGASLRTLERAFKSDFGTTPNRYILAARLTAVRHDLLNANNGNFPIAKVAMWNGFTHMGRFAREYKKQFGVLPSADRKLVQKKKH